MLTPSCASLALQDRGLGEYGALPIGEAYDVDADADDLDQEGQGRDGLHCLNLLGLNSCLSINTPPGIPFGDRSIVSQLCGVYLRNVDPVIKILHRPSLSKWLMDGKTYLGYPEDHSSVQALKSAVCYAAANTLSEAQCQAMCHTSKSTIVSTYRRRCEVALERADLLSTRCRIILQSFVLYLVSLSKLLRMIFASRYPLTNFFPLCTGRQAIRRERHRSLDIGGVSGENHLGHGSEPGTE